MGDAKLNTEKKGSNYDIFKMDALKRFLTYDQSFLIRRLNLDSDEDYIYIPFCGREYRLGRKLPSMEYRVVFVDEWKEADANDVLTICDLLCHTEEPLVLSGTFTTLEGLNRVQAGTKKTVLGDSFYSSTERYYDGKAKELAAACESLGGVPMGKGDVAYRIPLFGSVALQISYYESDDEFPAKMTFFLDKDICKFLFYETLWYMIHLVLTVLKERVEEL